MPDGRAGSGRLERRYRRLLRWYPPEHRNVHGDEMLAVLLAAARAAQEKPDRADVADLIAAAVRIRLRPRGALSDGPGWGDALAVFSVAAPLLMLVSTSLCLWAIDIWAPASSGPVADVSRLVFFGQALVVPFVLFNARHWAVVAAAIPGLFWLVLAALALVVGRFVQGAVDSVEYPVLASVLEVVALSASPGPGRGLQLMRGRHWALLGVAAVPAAALSPVLAPLQSAQAGLPLSAALLWLRAALGLAPAGVFFAIPLVLVLAVLLGMWLSSAAGKRMAVLFGSLAGPYLAIVLVQHFGGAVSVTPVFVAAFAAAVVAAYTVLVAAGRGRRRGPAVRRRIDTGR